VSYETFRLHAEKFRGEGACDLLICDEAHRLKNDQTLTNKARACAETPAVWTACVPVGAPVQCAARHHMHAGVSACQFKASCATHSQSAARSCTSAARTCVHARMRSQPARARRRSTAWRAGAASCSAARRCRTTWTRCRSSALPSGCALRCAADHLLAPVQLTWTGARR